MLNTGTNVNVCDNKNKSTPLHLAVNQGNEAGVRALLTSRHCDVNRQVNKNDNRLFSEFGSNLMGISWCCGNYCRPAFFFNLLFFLFNLIYFFF